MEKIDLILWIISGGFAITFGLMLVMWKDLNNRTDKLEVKMEKFDEKLTDIDRRLCRLEGAFASKDCCMIKEDRHKKAAM